MLRELSGFRFASGTLCAEADCPTPLLRLASLRESSTLRGFARHLMMSAYG